jgi:hypothetical protein
MRELGYQIGKLLGTITVKLISLRKGVYVAILIISLFLIFLYAAISFTNQNLLLPSINSNQRQSTLVSNSAHLLTNSIQQNEKAKVTDLLSNSIRPGRSARITNYVQLVNLRRTSGYLNKPNDDIIVIIPSGQIVNVIKGSQRSDDLIWWYVRWGVYEGWMAEYNSRQLKILELN